MASTFSKLVLSAGVSMLPFMGGNAALADDTPPPPSPFSAQAQITEAGVWDSNPLMLAHGAQSLSGSTTTPELILKGSTPTTQYTLDSVLNENIFNRSEFNSTDVHEKGNIQKDMQCWSAGLKGNFDYDTTRTSEITDFGLNLPSVRHTGYTATPDIAFKPTSIDKIDLNGSASFNTYDNKAFTDYNFYYIGPNYEHHFDPMNSAIFTLQASRYDPTEGNNASVTSYGPSIGWTSILTPRLTAKISGGVEKASQSGTTTGGSKNDNLNYVFSGDITFKGQQDLTDLNATRAQEPFGNGTESLLTTFSINETHILNSLFSVNAGALAQSAQYSSEPGVNLNDEYSGNVGVTYHVFTEVDLNTTYQYKRETLTNTQGTIRDQSVMLGITYHPTAGKL